MPDQDSTTRLIPLTQGQFAIVDAEDFERVNEIKWRAQPRRNNKWYARSMSLKGRQCMMHRFILGIDDPVIHVDHRDRNGLNNRKSNLRPCNNSQNHGNSSKVKKDGITSMYRGVSVITGKNKWRANICALGKRKDLGTYKIEIDAAHAYDAAAIKFFGEFANTNFPYVPPELRVQPYDPLKELQEIADDLGADGDYIACLKTEAAIRILRPFITPACSIIDKCAKAMCGCCRDDAVWNTPVKEATGRWTHWAKPGTGFVSYRCEAEPIQEIRALGKLATPASTGEPQEKHDN